MTLNFRQEAILKVLLFSIVLLICCSLAASQAVASEEKSTSENPTYVRLVYLHIGLLFWHLYGLRQCTNFGVRMIFLRIPRSASARGEILGSISAWTSRGNTWEAYTQTIGSWNYGHFPYELFGRRAVKKMIKHFCSWSNKAIKIVKSYLS